MTTTMRLTERQLERWHTDRARQSTLYHFHKTQGSRGDWQRRANSGVAYRTYLMCRRDW